MQKTNVFDQKQKGPVFHFRHSDTLFFLYSTNKSDNHSQNTYHASQLGIHDMTNADL